MPREREMWGADGGGEKREIKKSLNLRFNLNFENAGELEIDLKQLQVH